MGHVLRSTAGVEQVTGDKHRDVATVRNLAFVQREASEDSEQWNNKTARLSKERALVTVETDRTRAESRPRAPQAVAVTWLWCLNRYGPHRLVCWNP